MKEHMKEHTMNIPKTLESNADQDIPETRQALLTGERAEFLHMTVIMSTRFSMMASRR